MKIAITLFIGFMALSPTLFAKYPAFKAADEILTFAPQAAYLLPSKVNLAVAYASRDSDETANHVTIGISKPDRFYSNEQFDIHKAYEIVAKIESVSPEKLNKIFADAGFDENFHQTKLVRSMTTYSSSIERKTTCFYRTSGSNQYPNHGTIIARIQMLAESVSYYVLELESGKLVLYSTCN